VRAGAAEYFALQTDAVFRLAGDAFTLAEAMGVPGQYHCKGKAMLYNDAPSNERDGGMADFGA